MKIMSVRETPLTKLADLDVKVKQRPMTKEKMNERVLQLTRKFAIDTGGRLSSSFTI